HRQSRPGLRLQGGTARHPAAARGRQAAAREPFRHPALPRRGALERSAAAEPARARGRRVGSGGAEEALGGGSRMKLPISWLREWVEYDAPVERVAEALTLRGFYVEGVETLGHRYPGVVVARVLEVARHPNADRLSLCQVDGGAGTLSVVCGAPNVRPGMIAPLATVGAKLPDGTLIKK